MGKQFEQRPSGPAEPPPRPEHPARELIRKALTGLAVELTRFEMTTHGALSTGHIESVADALIRCYQDPRAFTISELHQQAKGLRKDGNQ